MGPPSHPDVPLGELKKRLHAFSSSQAVHQALSTALLEERGLPSLLGIWKTLTAKSRTA
jgi:hypothetical protein